MRSKNQITSAGLQDHFRARGFMNQVNPSGFYGGCCMGGVWPALSLRPR